MIADQGERAHAVHEGEWEQLICPSIRTRSNADYVDKFETATQKARKAGFLLPCEGHNLEHAAASLPIGG